MTAPLLEVTDVSKVFRVRDNRGRARDFRAVDGASFSLAPAETLAIVGESGSGKSTLGRLALRLAEPTTGRVAFDGTDITNAKPRALRALRPEMQVVFQDPLGSLNPRRSVFGAVAEPLRVMRGVRGSELDDRVETLLRDVGLDPAVGAAKPRSLSGGQRQRVAIARALALSPRLILADEAVSALDVSVQAQIINLFVELRERYGIAYVFIAHGLPIVRQVAQRVAVMKAGRIVEIGTVDEVMDDPQNPYTRALLAASPVADPRARRVRQRIAAGGSVLE
jgi:ABC-type oligopeptide transport system ATPase subunit